MAECPGVLELAAMADGGLARLRAPGGRLTSGQARGIAEAARRLGSGEIDITNRANLQIRGLPLDAGPALAGALAAAGLSFEGVADRRRNILLDPLSGVDRSEVRDLTGLARALDDALKGAEWIGALSPKFSYALDGGGRAGVSGVASDVTVLVSAEGLRIACGAHAFSAANEAAALGLLVGLARVAASVGPDARARDVSAAAVTRLAEAAGVAVVEAAPLRMLAPVHGVVPGPGWDRAAVVIPIALGRLDPDALEWLADAAEIDSMGDLVLTPWSAVVIPGVSRKWADALLARAEAAGFPATSIVERLSVVACAGALACQRAREPAKALALDILKLAAAEPELLPEAPVRLHLSACPKGCAGSRPADLLLLGASDREGWTLYRDAAPRAPGAELGCIGHADAREILALLTAAREPVLS